MEIIRGLGACGALAGRGGCPRRGPCPTIHSTRPTWNEKVIWRRQFLGAPAAAFWLLRARRSFSACLGEPSPTRSSVKEGPEHRLGARLLYRGGAGYETERQAGVWNARKPARFPRAIIMAESDADVVDAVILAVARGWQVATRSGGHSWTASHTRDNAILINLSRMKEISIHPDQRIAVVSPAWEGQALNKILREQYGLMFPSGHCHGVGLGGFVLAGGHGWNSRLWGPACANLRALDVVTAEGELIHASETENSDYLWAARGAGPGFFGVAVRYYLDLHPLPTSMKRSLYIYPAELVDEVLTWVGSIQATLPLYLEVSVIAGSDSSGRQVLQLHGAALAYSEADADLALAILDNCPAAPEAIVKQIRQPAIFPPDQLSEHETNPPGARYVVDGAWTSAPVADVISAIRTFFVKQPTPQSYFLWLCWAPIQSLGDMAYSLQGDCYLSPCAVTFDSDQDEVCASWVARAVEAMEPISLGGQMNDENLAVNKRRYLSDAAAHRLEALRDKHDPSRVFAGFLSEA